MEERVSQTVMRIASIGMYLVYAKLLLWDLPLLLMLIPNSRMPNLWEMGIEVVLVGGWWYFNVQRIREQRGEL